MKRLVLLLTLLIFVNTNLPANAGCFADKKIQIQKNFETRKARNEVKKVIKEQMKYSDKYNLSALSLLYSPDFISADGFDKEVYFKLIDDTWKSYPDITYTTIIKNIDVKDDTAAVSVYETSLATSEQSNENITIFGELSSSSNGTYYLKKINDKWLFVGEKVDNEKSFLKFGDTRFVNMDLTSPAQVKPGEYYTASLKIDLPKDSFAVASIGRDIITYPQTKTDEVFRKLPDDNILERMFLANKDGKNEFNVASIGLTKSEVKGENIRVYMAGIAFIMTRVNIACEVKDAPKDK